MIKEAIYRMATKADKETRKDDKYYCPFCFCSLIKRELRERIKNKEYQRLDDNTKSKLVNKEELDIRDSIKNPVVIKDRLGIDKENISERSSYSEIIDDIKQVKISDIKSGAAKCLKWIRENVSEAQIEK